MPPDQDHRRLVSCNDHDIASDGIFSFKDGHQADRLSLASVHVSGANAFGYAWPLWKVNNPSVFSFKHWAF